MEIMGAGCSLTSRPGPLRGLLRSKMGQHHYSVGLVNPEFECAPPFYLWGDFAPFPGAQGEQPVGQVACDRRVHAKPFRLPSKRMTMLVFDPTGLGGPPVRPSLGKSSTKALFFSWYYRASALRISVVIHPRPGVRLLSITSGGHSRPSLPGTGSPSGAYSPRPN